MKRVKKEDTIQKLSEQIEVLKEDKNILAHQIEEINKLVANLFISQNHLESLNKKQTIFVANISHELRTALNAILGFSQVMNDEVFGPIENKKYKEYIKFIQSNSNHLLSLVNEILDLSKIQANKMFLHETTIDLKQLLQDAIFIALQFDTKNNRNIVLHKMNHIILRADEKLMKQIFLNVLSNAVKFTKKEEKIDVFVKKTSFGIRLIFKDNGIGIPKEKINKLFQPFEQIENSFSRTNIGSGLGLVLVKKMVILHGGRIEIKSLYPKGVAVLIDLPQKRIVSLGAKNEIS